MREKETSNKSLNILKANIRSQNITFWQFWAIGIWSAVAKTTKLRYKTCSSPIYTVLDRAKPCKINDSSGILSALPAPADHCVEISTFRPQRPLRPVRHRSIARASDGSTSKSQTYLGDRQNWPSCPVDQTKGIVRMFLEGRAFAKQDLESRPSIMSYWIMVWRKCMGLEKVF